jgi:hypothetical protein
MPLETILAPESEKIESAAMISVRLLTLWEIMNLFDVQVLCYLINEIKKNEVYSLTAKLQGQGAQALPREHQEKVLNTINSTIAFCLKHGFRDSAEDAKVAKHRWEVPPLDHSAACEILNRLSTDIVKETGKHSFLRIDPDRVLYLDCDALFGSGVEKAFNSASRDIKEAGNCLAAECGTAAVFHLMRAAEVALRAVAVDRKVAFANKPLDQQEWGTILGALEGKLKDLRLADGKLWKDPIYKESQIRFYNEIIQELRGFNEAWRRHLSHADPEAFYGRDYAAGILKHVRMFMQKLATKISETEFTPEYWDAE